jgi:putative addiction module killer protein
MIEIRKTEHYANWLDSLRDIQAKARVLVRIERLASGNAGDVKPVGEGVSEMRINYGPGYRVYSTWQRIDCPAGRRRQEQPVSGHQGSNPACPEPIGVENAQNSYQSL